MTGMVNSAQSVTADVLLKKGHGLIKAVYVTKAAGAGSKLELKDGIDGTGSVILTIEGEAVQNLPFINKSFVTGLFAEHTTGGSYIVVWE